MLQKDIHHCSGLLRRPWMAQLHIHVMVYIHWGRIDASVCICGMHSYQMYGCWIFHVELFQVLSGHGLAHFNLAMIPVHILTKGNFPPVCKSPSLVFCCVPVVWPVNVQQVRSAAQWSNAVDPDAHTFVSSGNNSCLKLHTTIRVYIIVLSSEHCRVCLTYVPTDALFSPGSVRVRELNVHSIWGFNNVETSGVSSSIGRCPSHFYLLWYTHWLPFVSAIDVSSAESRLNRVQDVWVGRTRV